MSSDLNYRKIIMGCTATAKGVAQTTGNATKSYVEAPNRLNVNLNFIPTNNSHVRRDATRVVVRRPEVKKQ